MTAKSSPQNKPCALVVLGLPFHNVTFDEAVAWVRERMAGGQPGYVVTVNVDFIMQAWRDPEMQRILIEADLVVADGGPIVWLSHLFGPRLKQRVTGSDLTPMLAGAACDDGRSIYLLGGAAEVGARAAVEMAKQHSGLRIAGHYSPPLAEVLKMDHADILERIRKAQPALLLVAFGAPKQEKWINMHFRQWAVPVSIGIGGTLDFLAGQQTRAPVWVQKIGQEWIWRWGTNPKRLTRRYLSNLAFLASAVLKLLHVKRSHKNTGPQVAVPSTAAQSWAGAETFGFEPLPDEAAARTALARWRGLGLRGTLIVDLSRMTWLSSLELGVLLTVSRDVRRAGRRVYLCGVCERVVRLIRACHLDAYLDLPKTDAELAAALAVLEKPPAGSVLVEREHGLQVTLPAELTAANLDVFRSKLADGMEAYLARPDARTVLVDAAELTFLDSAAMGYLVHLRQQALTAGASVRFSGFHGTVLRSLKIARLDAVLTDK
ncbi:MAG: WecB/TagA/CpsF family glycosyltransferase [Kiritimatiellia bacterium]